jgi:hypothetical protein
VRVVGEGELPHPLPPLPIPIPIPIPIQLQAKLMHNSQHTVQNIENRIQKLMSPLPMALEIITFRAI